MKMMKKLFAIALVAAMVMALGVTAMAATQTKPLTPADTDNAAITINNPAKGETYSVFKLFDATVSADGKISYQSTGNIPSALTAFFTKDASNNVTPADSILEKDGDGKVIGSKMTDQLKAALETWAGTATATASEVSDGSEALAFTGLPYGYYVMTTSHKDDTAAKAVISVTSTKPNASIYDKNDTQTEAKEKKVYKASDVDNGVVKEGAKPIETVTIGDTVTYVAKFGTTNYVDNGTGTNGDASSQVKKYVISDTLPDFLTDVEIVSVTVGGTALNPVPTFVNKQFEIKWVDANGNSLYKQGAEIVVTYTAKITSTININTANKNTISIQPYVGSGDGTPYEKTYTTTNDIKTYGAAIKKVDQDGNALPGAQFTIKGLTVEGSNGIYTVVSYDPNSNTQSAVLNTDANGKLYIVGLASDVSLTVTEVKAPDGYNKLTETKTLIPQKLTEAIYKEAKTYYYDKDGNLTNTVTASSVERTENNLSVLDANPLEITNQKGTELPSTGGIGTKIFYGVGAVLVIGAGVVLMGRKRAAD